MHEHLDLIMFAVVIVLLLRGYSVAFTLAATGLAFAFLGAWQQQGYFATGDLSFLKPYYNRIFGLMDEVNEVLVAVPLFIFMGVMLERSKVAGELLEIAPEAPGCSTVLNGSFKGGHITRAHGCPAEGVHAVQLEMTQCSYMQEALPFDYLPERAARIQPTLERLLRATLDFAGRHIDRS